MGSTPSKKINLIYPLVLCTQYENNYGRITESTVHVLSVVYLRDKRIAVSYMNCTIVVYSIVSERFVTDIVIKLEAVSNDICEIDDGVLIYNDHSLINFVKLDYESYGVIKKIYSESNSSIKFCPLSKNRFATFGTGDIRIYSSKPPYSLISTINEENSCWINMLVELEHKDMLIISQFNDHNTILFSLTSKQTICAFSDIQIQCSLRIDEDNFLLGGKEYIWMMNSKKCTVRTVVSRKKEIGSFQAFLMMNDGMVLCGYSQNLVFLLNLKKSQIYLMLELDKVNPYPITYLHMIDGKRGLFMSCSSQGAICLWNYE